MKFGLIPLSEAEGAIAAHSVRAGPLVLKKGTTIKAADVERLRAAGIERLVAARLDVDDVTEDLAAHRLAIAVAGEGVRVDEPFTGRSNLFARAAGVLLVERAAIDAINRVDETITLATLPAFKPVIEGEMIGTVKIIPYAVAAGPLGEAEALAAGASQPVVAVRPYQVAQVGVISTLLPGLKPSTVDKTLRVLGERLELTGAAVTAEQRVAHETGALADELDVLARGEAEFIIVFGASAIADRRDVIPAAIERAGGRVLHFGMPVDPGNLLLVGEIDGKPVIGAPGCARSPKENGFDWVLHRLLAGIPVTRADITGMGVGGLLMEIGSRPQPRLGGESEDDEE